MQGAWLYAIPIIVGVLLFLFGFRSDEQAGFKVKDPSQHEASDRGPDRNELEDSSQ